MKITLATRLVVLVGLGASLTAPSVVTAASPLDAAGFTTFLEQNCVQCHGPDKQKGDLRLDTLSFTDMSPEDLERWHNAVDQVTNFDMPPDDDLALSDEEIAQFAGFLNPRIETALASTAREKVLLRRLNKEQYKNTVSELFGINTSVDDPARALPPDEKYHGFDNVGSTLTFSDLHLDAYLSAADEVVRRWAARAEAVPDSFRIDIPVPPGVKRSQNYGRGTYFTEDFFDLMHSAWTNRRFKTFVFDARATEQRLVPGDGIYRITVDAEAMHTDDPRGAEILKQLKLDWEPDPTQTPQFGFFLRRPSRDITPNIDQRVATFELDHGERKTMSQEVFLPGGLYTLAINFDTGPRFDPAQTASRLWAGNLEAKSSYGGERDAKYDEAMEALKRNTGPAAEITQHIASLPLPRIRFHSVIIEGPIADPQAPTPDYLARLDSDADFQAGELKRFATRMFRRPVSDGELAPYQAYAQEKGFQATLKALLCSPSFLYFHETSDQLDDFALANRLSYFLWNSMPDDRLFKLAQRGELSDPEVLRHEANRMIGDEKAASFFNRFTYQWLGLANMDDMPAARDYSYYHDFFVKDLYQEETRRFFKYLVKTNAPAGDLVHADYSFMNAPLARYYGVEGVKTSAFEKVSLTDQPRRRGLLGQGSVLTTSANGIDTSPVVRGIWVLEHLLGTPPSPPPPDVEVLEPDTRGTVSIRDMYAVHREDASCNRCHEDIDPLGFALENFDPVGQWREVYEGGLEVEAWGHMPDGRKFDDIIGLRQLLDDDQVRLVARHLLDCLLVSATGREMSVTDYEEIETILNRTESDGYRLKNLLEATVTSEAFLNK
ncbi:MAG: DUF1592 domain-containing protein [Verrucomicrobiota bacterium]